MKKLGLYSVLVSALLFTTGCSEKSADVSEVAAPAPVPVPAVVEAPIQDGTLLERAENGNYYMINGQRVLIEHVYFDFDKYSLNSSNKEKAVNNSSKLSQVSSDTTIKVFGNTDEWGSDEYNYALGLKRANAVKNVLVDNGVKANISMVSLGESNPVCTEKTKECWAKNRRVEHELEK